MLFSANPGEEPRPLRKIASGGELSRVTLAVKTVLAAVDRVPTLVFDEIDTGVGGRLGSALGKTLAELGRHHQVICVTHLPQMASYARRQWVIRKQVERGRSRTTIAPLDESERIAELAADAPRRFGRRRHPPGGHGHARRGPGDAVKCGVRCEVSRPAWGLRPVLTGHPTNRLPRPSSTRSERASPFVHRLGHGGGVLEPRQVLEEGELDGIGRARCGSWR